MPIDFNTYRETKFFPNLNGLRFICIAMVVWHHAPGMWGAGSAQILTRGFMGVDFFFVLSGFLITTLLLREQDRDGTFSLKGFYWRRFLRIIPVYFFVVTCVGAYYIFLKGETQYADIWIYYYLFLSNFLTDHIPTLSITWSLSVEEQFYLLWPLTMLLAPRRFFVPILLIGVALNLLGAFGAFGTSETYVGPLHLHLPNATYAPILMGSLVAVVLNSQAGFTASARAFGFAGSVPLALIALALTLQFTPRDVIGWPNLLIHSVMCISLITLLVRPRNSLTGAFESALIARIGQISYGIYLYHLLALDITTRVLSRMGLASDWPLLIAYSIVSVIVAEISFRTLEAYFQSFRHKRRERVPAA